MNAETALKQATQSAQLVSESLTVVLIGGTGFIGSQLAPILSTRGHQVIVASRQADPQHAIVGRDGWPGAIANADVVVLLSVINNDCEAPIEQFLAVNVDLPFEILKLMARSDQRLVLFGTDHADSAAAAGAYAATKTQLVEKLRGMPSSAVTTLILSPVHGSRFVKKLAFVDLLPDPLRSIAVTVVGALRPLTHADKIADAIETVACSKDERSVTLRVVDNQDQNLFYRATTRLFDLCFAIAVAIFFGWLMIVIAVLVASTSHGPSFFRQQRVGRNGHIFTCYKFRTMRINTPQVATHDVPSDSTTRIGKYLRKWKLDELPQILNIFANHMSLVGPRPCLPNQHELVEARKRLNVLTAKPGATGWSQVQGIDMSDPERLALSDADFCFRRSIPLYARIVLMTFLGKGQGDRIRGALPPDRFSHPKQ